MRHSLVASALEVMGGNARHRDRVRLFEIGPVFLPREGERLPQEVRRLVIAMTGPREPEAWQRADTTPVDFYDLKGVVESLLDGLHIQAVDFEPAQHPTYYPSRAASLRVDGEAVGLLGQLSRPRHRRG